MIEYEPVVCIIVVLRKHKGAFNISFNVNVVHQAIWMKYVFNLAALGSIQPRQAFRVCPVGAAENISLS